MTVGQSAVAFLSDPDAVAGAVFLFGMAAFLLLGWRMFGGQWRQSRRPYQPPVIAACSNCHKPIREGDAASFLTSGQVGDQAYCKECGKLQINGEKV